MRPANIITAIADILFGVAASGVILSLTETFPQFDHYLTILYLIVATAGLYGGGVVFNDVFDHELDAKERPERPIPSGAVTLKEAIIWGSMLFVLGIYFASKVSLTSGIIASLVATLAIIYNGLTKHYTLGGPLTMGACRAGNLLLGISIVPAEIYSLWYLSLIPILYIGAITLISQGEVHGGNLLHVRLAGSLYLSVIVIAIMLGWKTNFSFIYASPFFVWWLYQILPAWWNASKTLEAKDIMHAVKAGVIGLISLDAAFAAGYSGWLYGISVLALLPTSWLLAKFFAVT